MSDETQGVLTFSERRDAALEMLAAGRALGPEVTALALGEAAAEELLAHGADRVLVTAEDAGGDYCLAALARAVDVARPAYVLIAATHRGAGVAPRLAQRLGAGCASDCHALAIRDGGLAVERRCYGRFVARQWIGGRPALATIRPRRFEAAPRVERPAGVREGLAVTAPPPRTRVVAVHERQRSAVAIEKAAAVVAVGRGLKRRDDLPIIEELAQVLDAVVGGTRPVTDDLGWLPADVRIGLSGHTVKPRLYVACGVSGQIEHIVGMRESAIVVAIDRDPEAPIMQEADYRVTGDLYEVVPALTAELRKNYPPR